MENKGLSTKQAIFHQVEIMTERNEWTKRRDEGNGSDEETLDNEG